ncbi:MAG TPA: choice-of-anchor D domain-containing protein [Solirubrobacteraceae bacterium]
MLVILLLAALASAGQALAEGITNSGDDLRDGWYPEQSSLTPQLVSGGTFGQLWSTNVEGSVYAQPLLYNGTLLVATEKNKVYGLDPATGSVRWSSTLSFGTPWNPADIGCADLTPNIGVTATPVIDPSTNTAYMTHKTYASGSSGVARWYMDAIDLSSGAERTGFPVELAGAAQNQPGETFQPTTELQRPGLLLLGGVVYAAFGSHCDITPWKGWIFGVSTKGEAKARWVDETSANNGGGLWQSGAGLSSDGPGQILFTTGNGGAPTVATAGNQPPASLGESAVRVAVQPDGSLKPVDFFAPFNAPEMDQFDADFASGGLTVLNDQYFGTPSVHHLAVAVGKEGYVYLLNRESLGGFRQGSGGGDNVVDRIGPYGGVWSRPAVWPGDGGWIYIPTAYSSNGFLRVYKYGVSGSGQPTVGLQATSSDAYGFSSSAAVVTSEGTTSGSALVWIVWTGGASGTGAQLRAYDPIPVEGKPVLRWSAPVGTSSKFAVPGVGAGRIYVGNREGKVLGFGSPITPPLTGPATSFPTTTEGSSSEKTLTLTATTGLTLNKLTTSSSQFTVGTTTPALPATLSAGQTIQVPITFKPTQTGPIGASLTAETTQGNTSFSLSGTGQAASAQLTVNPVLVAFGGTSVGGELSGTATFGNAGAAPLTINAIKLPPAPFGATGVPAVGSTIEPGASVNVNVTFHPTSEGTFTNEIAIETTGGNGTIGLSGSAGPPGVLTIKGEQNEFGEVEVGKTASKSFTITNTGGTNVSITKSKPPSGGEFTATTTLSEGTTIKPGETLTESVTFAPTAAGPASGAWQLNGNDTTGLHEVKFSGTGVAAPQTFGKTSVGGSSDSFLADRKRVSRYSLAAAGSVTKLSIDLAPTGTAGEQLLKGVLYADSSGSPGALVATSAQLAFKSTSAAGWYDLVFSPSVKLAAGNYWIGMITGAASHVAGFRYDSVSAARDYNANTYTSGPSNPFGTASVDAEQASLYATYTPSPPSGVPTSTGVPTITGTARQGQTLTEHHGSWTGEPSGYAYQWMQCESGGGGCVPIKGATAETYAIAEGDVGHAIAVQETATNGSGSSSPATSQATAAVLPLAPVATAAPTITGIAQQGQTLTEHHGTWTGQPTGYSYQWLQCEGLGTSCLPIVGATGQTYTLTSASVGRTIEVEETASNAGGAGNPATSEPTEPVKKPPAPTNTALPTLTGTAAQGQVLTAHNGSWTGEPTSYSYQWLRCNAAGEGCAELTGMNASTYTLTSNDVESTMRVAVIATNAGGSSAAATSSATGVVQRATGTFGKTSVGGSSDSFLADRKRVNRYALAAAGSVTKLSIYLAPTATVGQQLLKGIVYADSSNAPGSLLGVSEQLTFKNTSAAGWYDLTFATPIKLAAGNYWIGVITGAASNVAGFRFDAVTGARDYNANTFTSGPANPFGTPSVDAEQTSLYATYTPG